MVSLALVLTVAFRSISLIFPHTYFQPDEFYQALEPAHRLVFDYGFLTWEWRDIPLTTEGSYSWWTTYVAAGRMRSWIWPGCYALVYKALQLLKLDHTGLSVGILTVWPANMQAFAPRLVGITVAALTDYTTYLLAGKLMGDGARAGAVGLPRKSLDPDGASSSFRSPHSSTLICCQELSQHLQRLSSQHWHCYTFRLPSQTFQPVFWWENRPKSLRGICEMSTLYPSLLQEVPLQTRQ